jgi:hypothetical protein
MEFCSDMRNFNASAFYKVIVAMQHTRTLLEERIRNEEMANAPEFPWLDNPNFLATMTTHAKELQSSLLVLGTKVTSIAAHRLLTQLKGLSNDGLQQGIYDIDSRLADELSLTTLFVLESDKQGYFEPSEPLFGKDVEVKFPSVSFELDEAAKCFALGRSTAAVFHLMRLMEIGINAVASCLSIPPPTRGGDRNWGAISKKIKDEMERRNASGRWADKEFFAAVYASLDAVRVAWRNTTMHVDNKYSEEESEHIFGAIRGFMRRLASRLDENGKPIA